MSENAVVRTLLQKRKRLNVLNGAKAGAKLGAVLGGRTRVAGKLAKRPKKGFPTKGY